MLTYTLDGSRIVSEAWGNNLLVYIYDEAGAPIGMLYRKTSYADGVFDRYLFERDVFGNIISVYNIDTGAKVGSYCYDAWGNCTVLTNTNGIGAMNPFRYRGYYLDTETNLYYLQSRYYDSYVGRFINADNVLYEGLLMCNLYAYSANNPVMHIDPTGQSWSDFWDALKEAGELLVKAAIILAAIGGAVLTITAAVAGTVVSGGAGAIAFPAAIAIAAECLAVVVVTLTTIGSVAIVTGEIGSTVCKIGENGTQTNSKTTWHGKGCERIDVENPSPGSRDGQIHYHDANNKKYMYDITSQQFMNPTSRLRDLLNNSEFLRGLEKALKILAEW